MPFFYDQTEIDWPEDGPDLPSPRGDQFVYQSTFEYTGVRDPVHFLLASIGPPVEPRPAERSESRGILARLLGRPRPSRSPQQPQSSREERERRFTAITVRELREIGAQRVYCRYDGGCDEGFSWLDSIEMQDGQRVSADELIQRLSAGQLLQKLRDARAMPYGSADFKDICDWLSNEWASCC
jgi:hypothetical protein